MDGDQSVNSIWCFSYFIEESRLSQDFSKNDGEISRQVPGYYKSLKEDSPSKNIAYKNILLCPIFPALDLSYIKRLFSSYVFDSISQDEDIKCFIYSREEKKCDQLFAICCIHFVNRNKKQDKSARKNERTLGWHDWYLNEHTIYGSSCQWFWDKMCLLQVITKTHPAVNLSAAIKTRY